TTCPLQSSCSGLPCTCHWTLLLRPVASHHCSIRQAVPHLRSSLIPLHQHSWTPQVLRLSSLCIHCHFQRIPLCSPSPVVRHSHAPSSLLSLSASSCFLAGSLTGPSHRATH
ncbi:unnamed protein product, partial [Closterium sp. NIES-53]